jgi:hypothetical protein
MYSIIHIYIVSKIRCEQTLSLTIGIWFLGDETNDTDGISGRSHHASLISPRGKDSTV